MTAIEEAEVLLWLHARGTDVESRQWAKVLFAVLTEVRKREAEVRFQRYGERP